MCIYIYDYIYIIQLSYLGLSQNMMEGPSVYDHKDMGNIGTFSTLWDHQPTGVDRSHCSFGRSH